MAGSHCEKENQLSVVAVEDIKKGELIVPLFVRRPTSIVAEGESEGPHHKSIAVDIEWTECNVSEILQLKGIEEPVKHEVVLRVNQELRLHQSNDNPEDWSGHEDLHPFWVIRRQKDGDEINCKICRQFVELTTAMELSDLQRQGANISGLEGTMMYGWYPFIVNSKAISKGDEVVLETLSEAPRKDLKRPSELNAFDQLNKKYRRMPQRK